MNTTACGRIGPRLHAWGAVPVCMSRASGPLSTGEVMRRFLFVLGLLLSGVAVAEEEPEIAWDAGSYFIDTNESPHLFWTSPECPEGFGPITIEMPPGWGYEMAEIDCGRVVGATEDDE